MMPPNFERVTILHDPEYLADTPERLVRIYEEIGKQMVELPNTFIIFKLSRYES